MLFMPLEFTRKNAEGIACRPGCGTKESKNVVIALRIVNKKR
jgi:hypothetical protein